MKKLLRFLLWAGIAAVAAIALGTIALLRGEHINSIWLVVAAVCTYALGYRFYAKFIAARVMALNDKRATPAERLRDGHDFEPTNKWIVFGHHFAAIAGPGPLVGPVLAAQFGYLPGTLWIIIGAVLGGCVQDFVILFASMRRDGKSLGQMAREEIGKVGGFTALLTVLPDHDHSAGGGGAGGGERAQRQPVGLRLRSPPRCPSRSSWDCTCATGGRARCSRSRRSVSGWCSLAFSWGRRFRFRPRWRRCLRFPAWRWHSRSSFTASSPARCRYGCCWHRADYLSTFIKLGVVLLLAVGILFVRPELQLPPFTRFVDGTGPIFAGKIFPFCFITIACGAISGFHSLISSGTTPKMIARESHARPVGYGSMALESFVAIMAMIAACVLQPGVYFARELARRHRRARRRPPRWQPSRAGDFRLP